MPYDLLVKDGLIVDGSGKPGYHGNVAVQDGRIVEVGQTGDLATRVISADGLVVSPGFVDIHTHYDAQVNWDPEFTSSCWHGVTSVVMGNCGFTLAPCKPEHRDYLMTMLARVEGMSLDALQKGLEWQWGSTGEYLDAIGGRMGINAACMVGHSTLRYHVMGEASLERKATEEEVRQMQDLLRQGILAGGAGLSSSQSRAHVDWNGNPVPSRQGDYDEIVALAQVLRDLQWGAVELVPTSIPMITPEERASLLRLAVESGRFVNWPGLFQSRHWPDGWREILAFLEQASAQGARLYGICASQPTDQEFDLRDNMLLLLRHEPWLRILQPPLEEKRLLLADPGVRSASKAALQKIWPMEPRPNEWDFIRVSRANLPANQHLQGKSMSLLAEERGVHPLDAMLDLALEEDLRTEFVSNSGRDFDPEAVGSIIRSPHSIIGTSDAGAHVNSVTGAEYCTYLLSHWVRERQALPLEEAIRKLTSMNASLMGFSDRGLIRPGMAADLCIFDPERVRPLKKEKVRDLPGGEERIVIRAEGIAYTAVNGQVTLENGQSQGVYPGRVLRSTDYMER